ncbi:glutamate--cysteine ligase [Actimicrobium sp. GrIS 1.19]|uniref:glutamate--cysteine ligase n=1 Tax=Actimicrobium sp. GrIS 1.19 TaxID=3071708 RepID=UPI002DFCB7B8|nr:glutamate--cysteine ligase [Actimicrobium sp. GrIS 1.19]
MSILLQQRLALLATDAHRALLSQGRRGIERETLRVDSSGELALTPHPVALGSALTHPTITTDYSESLVEFITPAEHDITDALAQLDAAHRYFYATGTDELLWSESMPCHLPDEAQIPIAWYGNSHIGMLKHVYRRGLALRYGKTMQCIAGVHYNFSLAEPLWAVLQHAEGTAGSAIEFQSESYIALIRNFHRYSWLLMYLFGASPALSSDFLRGRPHTLDTLSDDTLYLPHATSLRMSDLGYQNNAQVGLVPPYNDLSSYMKNLVNAVRQPYPAYEAIGAKRDGEWIQISTAVLQIENEFYSTIRPKRVINSGERPVEALCSRGVQYIEVRCLDIDPFEPVGVSLETGRFMDAFLLFCALDQSALTNEAEGHENTDNFALTVKQGRLPGLQLQRQGHPIALKAWGLELLEQISAAASLLDAQRDDHAHRAALDNQRIKLNDPDRTPSARVLREIAAQGGSFKRFAMQQSLAHAAQFRARGVSAAELASFQAAAQQSLDEQARLEREQTGSFDEFIEAYRERSLTSTRCY